MLTSKIVWKRIFEINDIIYSPEKNDQTRNHLLKIFFEDNYYTIIIVEECFYRKKQLFENMIETYLSTKPDSFPSFQKSFCDELNEISRDAGRLLNTARLASMMPEEASIKEIETKLAIITSVTPSKSMRKGVLTLEINPKAKQLGSLVYSILHNFHRLRLQNDDNYFLTQNEFFETVKNDYADYQKEKLQRKKFEINIVRVLELMEKTKLTLTKENEKEFVNNLEYFYHSHFVFSHCIYQSKNMFLELIKNYINETNKIPLPSFKSNFDLILLKSVDLIKELSKNWAEELLKRDKPKIAKNDRIELQTSFEEGSLRERMEQNTGDTLTHWFQDRESNFLKQSGFTRDWDQEEAITFTLDLNSKKFSEFIYDIQNTLQFLDLEINDQNRLTPDEFKNYLKNRLVELRKFLEE